MLYVTGDLHGDMNRFSPRFIPCIRRMTEEDCLFVCGDFGFLFYTDEKRRREQDRQLDRLARYPFHILFVDGNHENFPLICGYPEETWNGGRIHRIRRNIYHLMRGQIYTIEGKSIFTFGGAYSIDKAFREEGKSWWPQEMPSEEEYDQAWKNLQDHGWRGDYILTHAAPEETMCIFHPVHREEERLNLFLEWIREKVDYRHWWFGHLHRDEDLWRHQTALYMDVRDMYRNERIE